MLAVIENVNAAVNNFVWGIPAIICIIAVLLLSGTVFKLVKEYFKK